MNDDHFSKDKLNEDTERVELKNFTYKINNIKEINIFSSFLSTLQPLDRLKCPHRFVVSSIDQEMAIFSM